MITIPGIDSQEAVCFTGYRPHKLPRGCDESTEEMQNLINRLREYIQEAIADNKRFFINGLMAGFDVLATEQVISLKQEHPHIRCVTVAPFNYAYFNNKNWAQEWKIRARAVYEQSDIKKSLSENYRSGIYYERNRVMVDHSSLVICFYDGQPGGTAYTIDYAREKGIEVRNIYDDGKI